jgi:hypothetical protein
MRRKTVPLLNPGLPPKTTWKVKERVSEKEQNSQPKTSELGNGAMILL